MWLNLIFKKFWAQGPTSVWADLVETSNIINFETVPANCKDYVEDYLTTSLQYRNDSKTVCKEAYFYAKAKALVLKNDTYNACIFGLDDTLLSNVPFYAKYGYGYVYIQFSMIFFLRSLSVCIYFFVHIQFPLILKILSVHMERHICYIYCTNFHNSKIVWDVSIYINCFRVYSVVSRKTDYIFLFV